MRIGLLGGTFDPPHIGHELIARQVLDFTNVERVWFLPTHKHTFEKLAAPAEDRLAMTSLMRIPGTEVSPLEIDHKLGGQTIDLLPLLPPGNEYRFIIGSDQLSSFHLWGRWEELLERIPFLVFPRYGYPMEPLYRNMTVVSHPSLIATDFSSTKIRERVKAGYSLEGFVPQEVAEYISEKGLYL